MKDRVKVDLFHGLLVDDVQSIPARAIIRGLQLISDFEYEFQMALMNRKLNADIETAFIMTGMRWIFISSRIIKEVVMSGGDVSGLVPVNVEERLVEKLAGAQKNSLYVDCVQRPLNHKNEEFSHISM